MITVPRAASRTGRNPETIRRWPCRSAALDQVGTQHMIDEADLDAVASPAGGVALPTRRLRFDSGRALPDVVAALERSRRGR